MSAHPRSFRVFPRLSQLASLVTLPSLTSLGILLSVASAATARPAFAQTPTPVPVLTWRYDLTHEGQNTQETELTPANVDSNAFGKLFSLPVDDHVFAQPLYVPNLKMSDGQVHNVLFVATENDSIYAFDADTKGSPIWQASMLTAAHGAGPGATPVPENADTNGQDIGPNIGITGTPVINSATNTMYVVVNTEESGQYYSRLHAINIVTGAEQSGSPVNITATVAGTGGGNVNGQITFSAYQENQRSALNYYNGYVYIAYSSHGDIAPWQGWLFAYNATTLQQTAAMCLSPDDNGSSVWASGAAMPIDSSTGKMFVVTSNGGRSTPFQSNSDYGESVIDFNLANGQLTPTDAWTAFNYENMNTQDWDQGSGGLLMLPDQTGADPHLIITAGKDGRITVLNRDSLGGLAPSGSTSNTNAVQDFTVSSIPEGEGFWGTAAYWNGNVYDWAGGDDGGTPNVGMAFKLNSGVLTTTPSSETTFTSAFPGPTFSVSSNGTQNGIVWAVKADQFNSNGPAVLYAFDADDLSNILYESDTKSSDAAGPANKFSVPVVTNGKVYVAAKGEVDVYGLLNAQATTAAPVINPNGGTFTTPQSVTMSSATTGASIFYTLDGSTPTASSTQYTGAITVSTDTTVNAIATAADFAPSGVTSATFTFSNQTPPLSFSPAAGTYLGAQTVTISESDANAKIYYTTNGSTPSAASTPYSGPIAVGASETIKAVAIDPALANSNIGTAAYVIQSGGTSINFPNGFPNTQGFTLNGSAVLANTNQLQLTNNISQAGSVFWNAPINIQAFTTNFEFQINNAQANGFTFTIQNVGPTALGGDSAGLAYQDIQKSVAVKFNFYNYDSEGADSTGLYTDGEPPTVPTVDISPSGIELSSGDTIQAQIVYDGTTLTLNLHDTVNNDTFTTSWPINIPQTVGGNTAYIGFTGGTGGLSANQNILSWTYSTQAVPPVFAPPAGTYGAAQSITLSSQTADGAIYYTTDGSTPTAASTPYSAPFAVSASETINAVAISSTLGTSNVVSAAYVIQPGATTPSYSLSGSPVNINAPGASATSTITVTPNSGFTGSVSLACNIAGGSSAADAPTCAATQPPAITGSQAVSGTINVVSQAGTTPGNYTMNVTGTWGTSTQSTTVAIVVSPIGQTAQFGLSSTPITIGSAGANATSTITVTPSGGFTGNVSLSCAITASPSNALYPPTCSVTQPAAITGAQAVTATLTVNTTAAASAALRHPAVLFGGGSTLAALFFIFLPRRRRNWLAMLCLVLFFAAVAGVSGCSRTGGNIADQNKGTTAGGYTVTVTGSSGSLIQTAAVQVTVQ